MSPFKNVLQLAIGDFTAKSVSFVTLIYLARALGPVNYGTLEFGLAAVLYVLLLGDAGLEVWATRQAAQTRDQRLLAAQVIPLRVILAGIAFFLLLIALPLFPGFPALQPTLLVLGLGVFTQALNLKW